MPEVNTVAGILQLGFAAVMAIYLLTRTIPRMEDRADARDKASLAAAEKRDAAFLAALDKQRLEHKGEVDEARTWASEELRSLRETIDRRDRGGNDRNSNGGR